MTSRFRAKEAAAVKNFLKGPCKASGAAVYDSKTAAEKLSVFYAGRAPHRLTFRARFV
jgi:hypothetical protein